MATAGWRARPRWLAGDSGLGFPLWEHLEDEGTEGILTMALVGAGGRGLAGRRWTELAARVSRRGSVWSTENRSWGRDWMRWRDGVLLGALYRAGAASRGGGGEVSVEAG
jgi:hypothetical protein